MQLQFRTPMALAALHIRQYVAARELNQPAAAMRAWQAYNQDLAQLDRVAYELAGTPEGRILRYLGKDWPVDSPLIGPWVASPTVLRGWSRMAATRPMAY